MNQYSVDYMIHSQLSGVGPVQVINLSRTMTNSLEIGLNSMFQNVAAVEYFETWQKMFAVRKL